MNDGEAQRPARADPIVGVLGSRLGNLLTAVLADDERAAAAYSAWRDSVALDDIDFTAFRLLPLLVDTVMRCAIAEPELARIRGASKQAWLANALRAQHLGEVLDVLSDAGVGVLLMKGAALFARFPRLAARRGCGDYDILVAPGDAPRAVAALLAAGFAVEGVRMDLFTAADYDKIHGMHFARQGAQTVDLHWRPLPGAIDDVDDLVADADAVTFAGRPARVPRLDAHLFLTLARLDPADPDEIVLRVTEAALLLRACRGDLDWPRFLSLVGGHDVGGRAHLLFVLLAEIGGVPCLPDAVARVAAAARPPREAAATPLWAQAGPRDLWLRHLRGVLDFSVEPVAFVAGFSFPETLGRWTSARSAVLAVLVESPGPVTIAVEVRPFLPPGQRTLEATIFAGLGEPMAFQFPTGGRWDSLVEIPALALAADDGTTSRGGVAVVVMDVEANASPQDLGLSPDPRRLGLLVGAVRAGTGALDALWPRHRSWAWLPGLRSVRRALLVRAARKRLPTPAGRVRIRRPGGAAGS